MMLGIPITTGAFQLPPLLLASSHKACIWPVLLLVLYQAMSLVTEHASLSHLPVCPFLHCEQRCLTVL